MKQWPKVDYLQSIKPDPYLGEDRQFYQSQLELRFPQYDFNKLDDYRLMDIYDTADEDQQEIVNQWYEPTLTGNDDPRI